jgi:hypothetical protein
VKFDGLHGNVQLLRDVPGRPPLRQQHENLTLTSGQIAGVPFRSKPLMLHRFADFGVDLLGQKALIGQHALDGGMQLI